MQLAIGPSAVSEILMVIYSRTLGPVPRPGGSLCTSGRARHLLGGSSAMTERRRGTSPTRPLSLEDALRALCEPALAAEMIALDERGYSFVGVLIPGPPSEDESKIQRYRWLREKLEAEALGCLRAGVWVAEGFDRRSPIDAPRKTIVADWWSVLEPDWQAGTAAGGGAEIFGIVVRRRTCERTPAVSPAEPVLHIDKGSRRVRLKGHDLKLSPRPFKLLVMLAEAASVGTALVQKRDLEERVLGNTKADKALAGVVHLLRQEIDRPSSRRCLSSGLIENHRSIGYRLALQASEIRVEG